jgi:hypothetical protein
MPLRIEHYALIGDCHSPRPALLHGHQHRCLTARLLALPESAVKHAAVRGARLAAKN